MAIVYWLDTSVYIQAKNGPFGFKVWPDFWALLDHHLRKGVIGSPKIVYDEIVSNEEPRDDLAQWFKNRRQEGLCVPAKQAVQEHFRFVADHAVQSYSQPEAAKFLAVADPWLVAHALETRGIVVTYESTGHPLAKRIIIPNVCKQFNVPCINTDELVRRLKGVSSSGGTTLKKK